MTEAEEQELRALGDELADARRSPWEPRCVARAFATPLEDDCILTMQGWIDLEAIRSPILNGEPFADPMQITHAGLAFGLCIDERLTEEEALVLIENMREAINEAFAMSLPMKPRNPDGTADRDGFGNWLPTFAFLVSECGMAPRIALAMPVRQVLPLLSATRRNQGWVEAGEPYAMRNQREEEANG